MAEFGTEAMDNYDAYHLWLGIPPEEQPPSHYRLLGVRLFEQNVEVIRNAADRQRAHVKRLGINQHEKRGQDLLNEIEVAKICLLRPEKRMAYDEQLRLGLQSGESQHAASGGVRRSTIEEQLVEETLIIGSDLHCDVVIDLPMISGVHCSVMRRGGKVILRDLKSTNGTYVNFVRLRKPAEITPRDLVILGRDKRLKLPALFFPATQPEQRVVFIGRSDQCEMWVDDHTVSSFHARLICEAGSLTLEDLDSTNGTSLVDQRGRVVHLPPRVPMPVQNIESIKFGKHEMAIEELRGHTSNRATWREA